MQFMSNFYNTGEKKHTLTKLIPTSISLAFYEYQINNKTF